MTAARPPESTADDRNGPAHPAGAPPAASHAPRRAEEAAEDVCVVCRRGPAPARVCDRCRTRAADQLAALPDLAARLRLALVPEVGTGERVTSPRGEAPMPARLAALTLLAGGSADARCFFVPTVRVWTTTDPDTGLTWHRELVCDERGKPVMALADDQAGVLPVREWLRTWAMQWRHEFGHSTHAPGPARTDTPITARQRISPALLGIAAAQEPADRPADPVELAWGQRWPEQSDWGPVTYRHHAYLAVWLGQACERHPHIADFMASLRTLTAAVRAALGDIDDLEYLGRCPESIDDRRTGTTAICGAELWHDPYASVITCPRCHTETGQDRRIWLARRILDAWPIDRRRRYPRGLIAILRKPTCVTCAAPITVEWVDATERTDRERFWRPGTITCPTGCDEVM